MAMRITALDRWNFVGAEPKRVLLFPLMFMLLILGSASYAQELEETRVQTQNELQELKAAITLSAQRRAALSAQIDELDKDRQKILRDLVEKTKHN